MADLDLAAKCGRNACPAKLSDVEANQVGVGGPLERQRWTIVARGITAKLHRQVLAGQVFKRRRALDADLDNVASNVNELNDAPGTLHHFGDLFNDDGEVGDHPGLAGVDDVRILRSVSQTAPGNNT